MKKRNNISKINLNEVLILVIILLKIYFKLVIIYI